MKQVGCNKAESAKYNKKVQKELSICLGLIFCAAQLGMARKIGLMLQGVKVE